MRLIAITLAVLVSGPAFAQVNCAPTEVITAALATKYKEQQVFAGLTGSGSIISIWISPSGTWSALRSMPSGVSCLVASGENGEIVSPVAGDPT